MNLDAYFQRIGFTGTARADLDTLRDLHRLHPTAIPFENLSTLLREPVPLDPDSLEDKLVRRQRGGYCFEQNALFRDVLTAIGFDVTSLAARVVFNPEHVNPRTHMALLVDLDGRRYLCDVGFGGATLTAPLEFVFDREQTTPHERFVIVAGDNEYTVHVYLNAVWRSLYRFDLQPQLPIDYEAMNHYVSTWPDSHFLRVLMAGRPTDQGRLAMSGNRFLRFESGNEVDSRTIESSGELRALLTDEFRIRLPESARLDEVLERVAAG